VGIPEALVYVIDDEMTLSTWGKLVWGECKDEILAQELLPFPRLIYQQKTFIEEDYNTSKDKGKRVLTIFIRDRNSLIKNETALPT
jgi:hypothetical protein